MKNYSSCPRSKTPACRKMIDVTQSNIPELNALTLSCACLQPNQLIQPCTNSLFQLASLSHTSSLSYWSKSCQAVSDWSELSIQFHICFYYFCGHIFGGTNRGCCANLHYNKTSILIRFYSARKIIVERIFLMNISCYKIKRFPRIFIVQFH